MSRNLVLILSGIFVFSQLAVAADKFEPFSPKGFEEDYFLEATPGMKARIGADNREESDVSRYPYNTIGRIFFTKPNGNRAACTGTLVAKNIVLTNGHCVVDKNTSQIYTNIKFYPGYHDGSASIGYSTVKSVSYSNGYVNKTSGTDWAFLVLNRPLGNQVGWMGLTKWNSDWKNKRMFSLAGYGSNSLLHPFSGRWQTRNTVKCRVDIEAYSGRALMHDCDSGQGNSGSPLYTYFNGKPYIAGVNYGGWGPRNSQRMNSCSYRRYKCANMAAKSNQFWSTFERLERENR